MTISYESHTSTSYKGKLKQECTSDREPFTEKGNDGFSGDIAERFHPLCLKDSGVLYEDPYIQVRENAILLNLGPLRAIAMQESVFIFNYNRRAGKAFINSLLPRLNPKSADGGPVMPFELEVVEAALHSRIQRFEDRLIELDPRVTSKPWYISNRLTADILEQLRINSRRFSSKHCKDGGKVYCLKESKTT
ncbi:hypothetical protein L2E82_12667 [Cichorium intybus]|uniref:Uncharacterized protein n=1 Tax=Cichorium intybus TaxID=13427 RepID=A0ACB9GHX9_CICIN|nr:hypothetical protein L2E82_12667 [Cichorium intybus]